MGGKQQFKTTTVNHIMGGVCCHKCYSQLEDLSPTKEGEGGKGTSMRTALPCDEKGLCCVALFLY